jgi:hypothetical protein
VAGGGRPVGFIRGRRAVVDESYRSNTNVSRRISRYVNWFTGEYLCTCDDGIIKDSEETDR